jgi:hypothetical protein
MKDSIPCLSISVRHAARWRELRLLDGRAHCFKFATAGFAERLERILISRPDESAQLLNGKIRREILLGYKVHDFFRLGQHRIGGAKANAI